MNHFLFLVGSTVLLSVISTSGVPLNEPVPPTPPDTTEVNSSFENDTGIACSISDEESLDMFKNGLKDPNYRWTNFNVQPDPAFDEKELRDLNNALYKLSQIIPCVRFGIWPPDSRPTGDYVYVLKANSKGCTSYVGRRGGRQIMNLEAPGCVNERTILHESLHALGFHHEHNRYDRDDYIQILYENIIKGAEMYFKKYPESETTTFGVPYNIKSIMHYDAKAFTSNGGSTIVAKSGELIRTNLKLADTDIEKLKRMYNC